MGKSTISMPFSMAMLVYRRVNFHSEHPSHFSAWWMLVICATKPKSIKPKRPSSNSILHRAADVFLGKKWGDLVNHPSTNSLGKRRWLNWENFLCFFCCKKEGAVMWCFFRRFLISMPLRTKKNSNEKMESLTWLKHSTWSHEKLEDHPTFGWALHNSQHFQSSPNPNFGQGTCCPHEGRSAQNQHPSTACHFGIWQPTCLVLIETSKLRPPY